MAAVAASQSGAAITSASAPAVTLLIGLAAARPCKARGSNQGSPGLRSKKGQATAMTTIMMMAKKTQP